MAIGESLVLNFKIREQTNGLVCHYYKLVLKPELPDEECSSRVYGQSKAAPYNLASRL